LPRPGGASGAAVYHQVVRPLCHVGVEVVHQHAQRRLLHPAAAAQLGAAGRPDHARPGRGGARRYPLLAFGRAARAVDAMFPAPTAAQAGLALSPCGTLAHGRAPITSSAAETAAPLRIRRPAAASSGATNRSGPGPSTSRRTASTTAAVAGDGRSGRRKSSARAATSSSTARTWARFARLARSLRAAAHPMETWSSCMAEVGIESALAGRANRRLSATRAAAVYWAVIIPEATPGSAARG